MSDRTPDPIRAQIEAVEKRIAADMDAALFGGPRRTEWQVTGLLQAPLTLGALLAAIEPLMEAARQPQLIRIIVREDISCDACRRVPLDGGDFEYHLGADAWFKLEALAELTEPPLPPSVPSVFGAPVIFVKDESEIPDWHRRI